MKTLNQLCLLLHALPGRRHALLSIVTVLAISGTLCGQSPVGTVSNIPFPDSTANAFSTSLRYDSSGNLYAWDGLSVWEQSGGTGAFSSIGSVTPGNQADAGPISFSQNGTSLLLSNGAGGFYFSGNGGFYTMPASGGSATQVVGSGVPYAYDALALPAASTIPNSSTKYIVNEGNSTYDGSSLSIFDTTTGSDTVVVDNGPGATTSIAINPKNNSVYVGIGYGPDQGNIYSFSLAKIDSAYLSGTPIDFLSGGTLFNPIATGAQNGAGMFFDSNGYLFSGGGGTTVFRPDGTICYDQVSGAADGYYASLTYDPATNEVLKVPYGSSTGTLYNAADFESAAAAVWANPMGGSWSSTSSWSGGSVPSGGVVVFAGSTNGTAIVRLDGNQSAGALVFSLSNGNGYTLSQGTGGGALTLGTSAGASISILTGTYSITAPIVLAGSLAVRPSNGGSLQLGNISQAMGVSAALSLSGEGELILNGSDTYTGGTTVTGALLQVGAAGALPTAGSVTVTGGTLDLGAFTVTTTNAVSFQGGVTQDGVIVNNGSPYDGQGGTVTASLQGTAGLNMTGYGTLVLAGTNTYGGGTIVTEGTLELLNPAALPEGSALTVGSDAAWMFAESSDAVASRDAHATVPEPCTLGLLAAGVFAFVAARVLRRRDLQ